MAHNLFGERFFSLRELPWHSLGIVSETECTATQALEQMGGYEVEMRNLIALGDPDPKKGRPHLNINDRCIVRRPTKDDPSWKTFGIVGADYTLVDPQTACKIWDKVVKRPVETIGALGSGETLFVSTNLPTIDIKGDEVANYLLLVSPMMPGATLQIRRTPVRVVCRNTLMMAKSMSTENYQIRHDQNVLKFYEEWLEGVYDRAVEKLAALKEVFEIFAETKPTVPQVEKVLEVTYPIPEKPKWNAPDKYMEQRMSYWEENKSTALRFRGAVQELFAGSATGFKGSPLAGSAWHLYNSVAEWEDHRDSRGKIVSAAQNALFGDRAAAVERAYTATYDICKN